MHIDAYLRAQFELASQSYRDVAAYLLSAESRDKVMVSPPAISCHHCNAGSAMLSESLTVRGEVRYRYTCAHCQTVSGEWQRSPSIAYWNWFAKKSANPTGVVPPVVQSAPYVARFERWWRAPREKSALLAVEWIASTKWVKMIWSQHRATSDYTKLSHADQLYVDAIGAAIDVLRQQAVQIALLLGVDVADPKNAGRLKAAEIAVQQGRLQYYSAFSARLTPGLRLKADGLLGINLVR